jgi:hypothetical protein
MQVTLSEPGRDLRVIHGIHLGFAGIVLVGFYGTIVTGQGES